MRDATCGRLAASAFALAAALGCSSTPTDPVVEIIDPERLCGGICYPRETWTQAPSPGALGWSPSGLDRARAYSDEIGSNAVMVIDRGLVVTQCERAS